MYSPDRPFSMPFHEAYLLDYLISNYGTSIPMEAIKAFIVIVRLWMFMYCEILAKACNFLLTWLQIFTTWVSNPKLLFKLIPNSFLLLLFLMTPLSTLIEKGSSVLKMRWHLSAFAFKKLFKTIQKVLFQLLLIFLEWRQHFQNTHTECYHLRNS